MWVSDSAALIIRRSREVTCDCCGWHGHRFFLHTFVSGTTAHRYAEEICPRCEALGRQRQLVRYLRSSEPSRGWASAAVLEIGPSGAEVAWLQARGCGSLVTVDLIRGVALVMMDIMSMGFRDAVFDAVICSHVLEHVSDDVAALQEIRRVLKPEGLGIIQVPVEPALQKTIEYGGPNAEEFDHVRAYGQDFASRLGKAGFVITTSEDGLFEAAKASS